MTTAETIRRIKVEDVPFSPDITDAVAKDLAELSAFSEIDDSFRNSPQFLKLLKMHTRLIYCLDGDIIVRKGDWGNSAFFIIAGTAVVEIEPPGSGLSEEVLGRGRRQKKGFFQALAQWWTNRRTPEFRSRGAYDPGSAQVRTRGRGRDTRIYLQDVPAVMERYKHAELTTGQLFGEIAALGRSARTATVFAKGHVELLELRWQGLRDLMRRDAGFQKRIDMQFRKTALRQFLEASPVFEHLRHEPDVMEELAERAELSTFGDFDRAGSFKALADAGAANDLANEPLVVSEGDYPNGVIMIRSGLARVSHRHHHGHQTVSYLNPGQMYGLTEVAAGWQSDQTVPFTCSLRAIGFLMTVVIPTPLVEKYVLARSDSNWKSHVSLQKLNAPTRTLAAELKGIGQDDIEFLVQERFVNGTAAMLIDLDRCTRCDDCVRACASTHDNNPRFLRSGPVHNNVMVANACMHCQDPVCLIECPTGAISRRPDEGQVAINDDTCIGCRTCANNCPYDAIRMVEIRDEQGRFIRDKTVASRAPITKATKCDLCVDQLGGPACQRACPHDALVRLNVSDVESLAKWGRRK